MRIFEGKLVQLIIFAIFGAVLFLTGPQLLANLQAIFEGISNRSSATSEVNDLFE